MERGTRARGHTAAWLALALALALCWLPGLANAQTRAAKITLDQTQATLFAGDTLALAVRAVLPASAQQGYTWGSTNPAVATVDENGLVTAHKQGAARIYAQTTGPGKARGVCQVTVKRPQIRRALVVGNGAASKKLGLVALPSVQAEVRGVGRALAQSLFPDGYGINLSTKVNITKAELKTAITRKFQDATQRDISYLYITGHGLRAGGEYYIAPCRDKLVSARELRTLLDQVPGKIVLVINACYSGTVISGKAAGAAQAQAFGQGFVGDFLSGGSAKYTAITGEKYLVLCATGAREEGWIYLDGDTLKYLDTFGTPFSAGVGWDYTTGERSLLADLNGDFQVTHRELYQYLKKQVAQLAGELGCTQTVTAYPAGGSDEVLFDLSQLG